MIGYDPSPAEEAARALFGIGVDIDEVRDARAVDLGLDRDVYDALRTAAEECARVMSFAPGAESAIRAVEEQLLALVRLADLASEYGDALIAQTFARPHLSRMHAAYRAKTRRRNRR